MRLKKSHGTAMNPWSPTSILMLLSNLFSKSSNYHSSLRTETSNTTICHSLTKLQRLNRRHQIETTSTSTSYQQTQKLSNITSFLPSLQDPSSHPILQILSQLNSIFLFSNFLSLQDPSNQYINQLRVYPRLKHTHTFSDNTHKC